MNTYKSVTTNKGLKAIGDTVHFPTYDNKNFGKYMSGTIKSINTQNNPEMVFFQIQPSNNMYCDGKEITRSAEELNLKIISINA